MWKRRRTKENLIPFEKSKRVIRIERRGRETDCHPYAAAACALLAVLSWGYFVAVRFFMGHGTNFFYIWLLIGAGLGGLAFLLWRQDIAERIPRLVRRLFWGCLAAGVVLFAIVMGMVLTQIHARATAGAGYMIVLGAQWKGNRPSYMLQQRLDTAAQYLHENPDTFVIVSGGKGSNEVIPEAEGMALYLEQISGIAPERILREEYSKDTYENLLFSANCLDKAEDRVVIVTNNYHMFRALKTAQKQGYKRVEGLAAPSYAGILPNNLLREFFGVMKNFLEGNI
ncbi:MAG: YdcF family protein [Lachnospiraceae bacterium]|nr:YdcF family protein [Lachnospiraceae bacterium]